MLAHRRPLLGTAWHLTLAVLVAVLACAAPASAHEGHDHGELVTLHADGVEGADGATPISSRGVPASMRRMPRAGTRPGPWETAVLLIHFPGQSGAAPAYDPAAVRSEMYGDGRSVRQFYLDQTYGAVDIQGAVDPAGDVFGSYAYPGDDPGCQFQQWAEEAMTQAAAQGFDRNRYQSLVFVFSTSRCSFAGLGGGSMSWINGMNAYTVAHEMGHGFGNAHAQSARCESGGAVVAFSGSCTIDEYGDPFDPMGRGGTFLGGGGGAVPHHMHPARKLNLNGAMSEADAPTANTPGRYRLAPVSAASGTRMLRLPGGRGDDRYFSASVRQPTGPFESTWADPQAGNPKAYDGVLVTWNGKTGGDTQLLDMTPETPAGGTDPWTHQPLTGFEDARLTAGRSFTDAHTGLTLTTVGVSAGGAEVDVAYGRGAVDVATPGAPGTPTASVAAGAVTLSWAAAQDGFGVARYLVRRSGAALPDATGTSTVDRPGVGTFSYDVRAVDAAGFVGPASGAVQVVVPPATPSAASALALTKLKLSRKRFTRGSALAKAAAKKRKKPAVGTSVTFTLNRAARVTLAFARQLPGRRSGSKCVARSKAKKGAKRCTRSVPASRTVAVTGKAGANRVSFTGALDRRRKLAAGAYVLTATARDAGGLRSRAAAAKFTLVQPAR